MNTFQDRTEAQLYYAGLHSKPLLIARSSSLTAPWKEAEAYTRRKELRPVGNHALSNGVWEDKYAPHVLRLLESKGVMYTSVDVVRIANVGEPSAPVIVWIGVVPKTLAPSEGLPVALMCKEYLEQNGITDVDVELRESVVVQLAGPKFLEPDFSSIDPIIEVCRPLTSTLGLSICAKDTAWHKGTGGLFIAQGGGSNKILLVTARHVVFPPLTTSNDLYEYKNPSQPRRKVLLLGDGASKALLESTETAVRDMTIRVEDRRKNVTRVVEGNATEEERKAAQAELVEVEGARGELVTFRKNFLAHWSKPDNRVIGHVVFSPPLTFGVGDKEFTRDFALIEMDASKFNASNFKGNVIDLGTQMTSTDFRKMMHPHPTNSQSCTYPRNRLLPLKGTISREEMCNPTMLGEDGEPCLMVLKRGAVTGLTIGRANNIASFVRQRFDDSAQNSKEWAIFSRNHESAPFSKVGDSGSVVVDGRGRIGGLITGGNGPTDSSDVTYVTPIDSLQQCIAEKFPNAHLYPVLT